MDANRDGNLSFDASDSTSGDKYILFVHGWRMDPWSRRSFAETAFKRLWWQGYKGRFGLFSWPTEDTAAPPLDPQNYDRSERKAYVSGWGLHQLLIDLDDAYPDEVRVVSHSMGAVVVSEALRLEAESQTPDVLVHTYVASQGAMAAHA